MQPQTVRSKTPVGAFRSTKAYRAVNRSLHHKSFSRRLAGYVLVGFNLLLLAGVLSFVLLGHASDGRGAAVNVASAQASDRVANPLDQVSSADIAVNIARLSALPETTAIVNQADSVNTELMLTPAGTSIVDKPQIVATALKSKKDIRTYVTVPGDTVTSVATKFGVTSDSVRWSNNLASNSVNAGQTLYIPPVTGIVHMVAAGDTPDTLAAKFKASKDAIIVSNDAELSGLKVGERILIPDGVQPAPVVNTRVATASYGWGGASYGNNSYTRGYCTWYVANQITVPNNWGNANTWDNRAAMSGWVVSSVPRVGAIGQTDRGSEGHVAIIEAVSEDGTMIKYSDMNGLAGWGSVGRTPDWVSAAKFEHYIYQ
ncbi:MAG TPA: CHAP domain-containing protein [Candidatus Saccharimonadales bacterium]|nr:CHAP domain-containing protein [Candidatus Saccharimonadales bacterium]